MQELPDTERRNQLQDAVAALEEAQRKLPSSDGDYPADLQDDIGAAEMSIGDALATARDRLDEIPEWDEMLVRDLVLEHTGRRDTDVTRMDNEVVLTFEEGPVGDVVECRYSVAVTSGNEWFHIADGDGGWDEVWSN